MSFSINLTGHTDLEEDEAEVKKAYEQLVRRVRKTGKVSYLNGTMQSQYPANAITKVADVLDDPPAKA
jgi:hypothetical protein